jgi:broad specificity phosphatase PhoE
MSTNTQSIFIIRHGDRYDYAHPEWRETATRKGDPSLSSLGHRQARETGQFLDNLLSKEGIHAKDITFLSSPFLRCIQTSNEILSEFKQTPGDVAETVTINPEYGVFEVDFWNGRYHEDLPTVMERKCYFPRLNENYTSLMIPQMPENKPAFHTRCDDFIKIFNKAYPHTSSSRVIIVVSHAAGCVGLARSASQQTLQDINPASACAVFRLTRTSNSEKWDLDHYSMDGGMNGHSKHISDQGIYTIPWNHFGDKSGGEDGYTGPPMKN